MPSPSASPRFAFLRATTPQMIAGIPARNIHPTRDRIPITRLETAKALPFWA
jgi:hypothetical protein